MSHAAHPDGKAGNRHEKLCAIAEAEITNRRLRGLRPAKCGMLVLVQFQRDLFA